MMEILMGLVIVAGAGFLTFLALDAARRSR